MIWLILGLVLWTAGHLFKRLAPDLRAGLGDAGKGVVAVVSLAGIVLMVLGYRAADPVQLWFPPAFMTHANNALMVLAVYLFAVSGLRTGLARIIRHPQLTGVKTWAVAHLLVNGDLASVVLFGGLLGWAVVSVILINRAERAWTRPAPVPPVKELQAIVFTAAFILVIGFIHGWLGHPPYA